MGSNLSVGSAQNLQLKDTLKLLVQLPREDRIAVVDQELIRMVAGDGFPELLQCPVRGWMRSHVVIDNAATPDLHHQKNIKHLAILWPEQPLIPVNH